MNPATYSDSLVAGKATLCTPFCVHFSDRECNRYSTFQANKAVQSSRKIDMIAAISAKVSIQDMLGIDSLTPPPQVHASYKEIFLIVHPDKNSGIVVDGESQAFQKIEETFKVSKDAHDANADNSLPINQRSWVSLMGPRKVPLLHPTTTPLVTVLLRRTSIPFTIGMRVCNFLVTRRFQRSSLNFAISLLHPAVLG